MIEGTLEVTTVIGCLNNCKYCPQDLLIKNYGEGKRVLSFVDYKKILKKVPKNIRIHFSGMAEPWLNKRCTDMLLYAHETGYKIAVYTTLVGMKKQDLERIAFVPFDIFMVHLADSERNAKIDVNMDYIEKVNYVLQTIDCAKFMTMGNLHPALAFLSSKLINIPMISRSGNVETVESVFKTGRIRCGSSFGLKHNVLLPDGRVLLCCMDYGMKHVLGNLLKSDYESLFDTEEYRRIVYGLGNMESNEDVICRKCENAIIVK